MRDWGTACKGADQLEHMVKARLGVKRGKVLKKPDVKNLILVRFHEYELPCNGLGELVEESLDLKTESVLSQQSSETIDMLLKENAELKGKNETLEIKNGTLETENKHLKGENETLEIKNGTLETENKRLRDEVDKYRKQVKEFGTLEIEKEHLRYEVDKYKNQLKEFRAILERHQIRFSEFC